MSTVTGGQGNIVTNGLVLNLDAANPRSYAPPYNGTVWRDLSGNNNDGTLTNGPTYNSLNGGSIVFDGVNDYVTLSTFTYKFNTPFTISIWVNPITVTVNKTFISNYNAATNNGVFVEVTTNNILRFVYRNNSTNIFDYTTGDVINSNTIYNIVAVYDAISAQTYINNVRSIQSASATQLFQTTNSILEINRLNPSLGRYMNTNTFSVQIYNRALSATEILQNYNATRARFNL